MVGVEKQPELFNRWELKYIIPVRLMHEIIEAMEGYVLPDKNGENGMYKISSLYYDTYDFKFYHEKLDGVKFRQKVRLRTYGEEDAHFFEIKQRCNSTVHKKRTRIDIENAYALASGGNIEQSNEAADEVKYLFAVHSLVPKVNVTYHRRAYFGVYEDDLRVTFDTGLKCAKAGEKNEAKYMLYPGLAVMEVKANDRVPVWMISIIQRYNLEQGRISKYCMGVEALYNI